MLEYRYGSWAEFYAKTISLPDLKAPWRHSQREDPRFHGCSLAEAHRMALDGWLDGAARINKMSDGIVTAISPLIERFDVVHEVEGQNLDIARYLEGDPECWMQMVPTRVEGSGPHFFNVVVNNCVSGGCPASIIETRGAAIVAAVNLLELTGARVQLTVVEASEWRTFVRIKRYEDCLDLPMVAYIVGHPSALRVHFFSHVEVQPDIREFAICGGYGAVRDLPPEEQGDLYVNAAHAGDPRWLAADSARVWVFDQLGRLGVKLHHQPKIA